MIAPFPESFDGVIDVALFSGVSRVDSTFGLDKECRTSADLSFLPFDDNIEFVGAFVEGTSERFHELFPSDS
jgi:hypothetical protein